MLRQFILDGRQADDKNKVRRIKLWKEWVGVMYCWNFTSFWNDDWDSQLGPDGWFVIEMRDRDPTATWDCL